MLSDKKAAKKIIKIAKSDPHFYSREDVIYAKIYKKNLKNALAYSARTEKPFVSKHIADMLANIENIIDASEVIDKIENRKDGDSGFFGTFFDNKGQ